MSYHCKPPKYGDRHYVTKDISVRQASGMVSGPSKGRWWVSRKNTERGGDIWLINSQFDSFREALAHARELAGSPQESSWQDKKIEERSMKVITRKTGSGTYMDWRPKKGDLFTYLG